VTLREYGQSIVEWWHSLADRWDAYLFEITTKHVLDWSIGHLVLTAVGGLLILGIAAGLIELVLGPVLAWLSKGWERTGLPYLMVRLDKRFGPLVSGFIMVALTFAIVLVLGLLAALWELASR
jgi:hypothetical protein